ncbi:MAG: TetR/AcrR family transcriptional regulator [Solirubrobacteraceae bacterium]|nr:TetR/AcrR family transcriptional regulator [Solirubrobacteraceae bacterium]
MPHPRRAEIAQTAAGLMNRGGYVQTSVAELLDATGLEKGGLYHHFRSKEEIALAAFDHAHGVLLASMAAAIDPEARPRDQLAASVDAAFGQVCASELGGGCPMVRLSTDAGDRHPALKARAGEAMQGFRDATRALLRADPDPPSDPDALGDLIVTLVEGAMVVREVTGDDAVLEPARAHVHALLAA